MLFGSIVGATRRPYPRYAFLAATAVALAFAFGSFLPQVSAGVAAISALFAVRPTFHASTRDAFIQILALALGGTFAYFMAMRFGGSSLILFVSVVVCFIAAWILRLGEEGALSLAMTVILVIGFSYHAEQVETRFLGVLVGVMMGMLMSLYTRPGTPQSRALDNVLLQADNTSALLSEIAEVLTSGQGQVPEEVAGGWFSRSEDIVREIAVARHEAEDAVEGSRWSPLIVRKEAQSVVEQVDITEATALTVQNMCRDL